MDKILKLQEQAGGVMRGIVKNISSIIVVIFFILGIFIALGATLDIDLTSRQFQAVTLFTALSSVTIFFIWRNNGKSDGFATPEYRGSSEKYSQSSKDVDIEAVRKWMKAELLARKEEFEKAAERLSGLTVDRIYSLSKKELKKQNLSRAAKSHIEKCRAKKYPKLAFKSAEEIINVLSRKTTPYIGEIGADHKRVFTLAAIISKLSTSMVYIFMGAGIAISISYGGVWNTILTVLVMILLYAMNIASGYSVGHKEVAGYEVAILNTATKYLVDCEKYAMRTGESFRQEAPLADTDFDDRLHQSLVRQGLIDEVSENMEKENEGD